MFKEFLSYAASCYFFQPNSAFEFELQGKFIRARSKDNIDWSHHLSKSKSVIKDFTEKYSLSSKDISILGCGSLFDLPESLLAGSPSREKQLNRRILFLHDANPHCVRDWNTAQRKNRSNNPNSPFLNGTLIDVSGILEIWGDYLIHQLSHNYSFKEMIEIIKEISNNYALKKNLKRSFIKASLNISLNILSQIPVYWQNLVFNLLRKKFGDKKCKEEEYSILSALLPSSTYLITSHLNELVPERKNQTSLVLTDINYHYIEGSHHIEIEKDGDQAKSYPINIKTIQNSDNKEVEISHQIQNALFSLTLKSWQKKLNEDIECKIISSWLWKREESKNSTTYNEVIAFSLSKKTKL